MKALSVIRHITFLDLEQTYKHEKNSCVKTRLLVIMQLYLNKSTLEAAFHVHIAPETVRKWIHRWNEYGLEGLEPKKRKGRHTLLSKSQQEQIKQDIHRSPREQGYMFSNWCLKDIKGHIAKKYGVEMSISGVWRSLQRWYFTLLVPRPMPIKADKKKRNFPARNQNISQ